MMKSFIISRFNEDISWALFIKDKVFVYNKGPLLNVTNNFILKNLPNKGRETDTYLNHIINNYNNLDELNVFLQGRFQQEVFDPFKVGLNNLHNIDLKVKAQLQDDYIPLGDVTFIDDREGRPWHPGLNMLSISTKLFEFSPEYFRFTAGANFIASKEILKFRSLDFWKKCRDLNLSNEKGPWIFERLWPLILNKNVKVK